MALDLRLMRSDPAGTYLRGLLAGFAEIAPTLEWTFIGPRLSMPASLNVADWIAFDAEPQSIAEFRHYPSLRDVDLFHFPAIHLPRNDAPAAVATLHDLHALRHGSRLDRQYQRLYLRRLAWSRAGVIAPTATIAEELQQLTRIPARRIAAIAAGPGEPRVGLQEVEPRSPLPLPDGSRLGAPWLLVIGGLSPLDNMEFFISAMALWYRRRPEAPPLVWALPAKQDDAFEEVAEAAALIPASARSRIFIATCTDRHQLHRLYSGAKALLYPPLEPRHAFRPLEAMARGLPLVCSRHASLVERLDGAPLWFDPEDSSSLWRVLDGLLDVEGLLEEAGARSRRRAAARSWADVALETLAVYHEQVEMAAHGGLSRRWLGKLTRGGWRNFMWGTEVAGRNATESATFRTSPDFGGTANPSVDKSSERLSAEGRCSKSGYTGRGRVLPQAPPTA